MNWHTDLGQLFKRGSELNILRPDPDLGKKDLLVYVNNAIFNKEIHSKWRIDPDRWWRSTKTGNK